MFCFSDGSEVRIFIKANLDVNWIQSKLIKNIYNEIYMHLSSENVDISDLILINADSITSLCSL